LLLEKGADPRARKSDGTTPLHLASSREEAEVVRLLLKHGADVEAEDDYGRTAFDVASERGCDEIMKLLLAQPQAHATGVKDILFYLPFIFYLFYLPLTSARKKAK
jgi:ankyrin repeat protein